jgi:hypothetical protein
METLGTEIHSLKLAFRVSNSFPSTQLNETVFRLSQDLHPELVLLRVSDQVE